jgi:ribonuclease HII
MIMGIDEVGRGCWAGPLVAGAVVLHAPIAGLADSKKLTKKMRDNLALEIYEKADVGLGWVTSTEVDALGLTKAVGLAMERAYAQITSPYDEIIIDGNINYFADNPKARAVIRADGSVPSVSAASIVAKVARDTYMTNEAHTKHPEYGFANHVGYGTKAHIAALEGFGITPLHRQSYKPIQRLLV